MAKVLVPDIRRYALTIALYHLLKPLRQGSADLIERKPEMSVNATREFFFRAPRRDRNKDLAIAAAAMMAAFAVHAFAGFTGLSDARGDNDSLMRLVEVRDLIAGQGWFELHQDRMGLEGGFVMHWSRLVDAPIAGIILAGTFLAGDGAVAERIASIAWPLLLYGIAVFLVLRAAVALGGNESRLPAIFVGAATLYAGPGLFEPGSLDHHNLQLVLALVLVVGLLSPPDNRPAAYAAGASAALMLAIGMEAVPYVAIAGTCVAGMFLIYGATEQLRAIRFGLAFGATASFSFMLTVPVEAWLAPYCDAYSVAQFSVAALAGFGLALTAALAPAVSNVTNRAFALGGVGAAVVLLVVIGFPQCIDDPYAGVPSRLREIWLDSISEAQSVRSVLSHDPRLFANYYITPLLALAVIAFWAWRRRFERRHAIVAAFLVGAVLVSFWQVRGSMFSVPIAVIPLAAWIGERRVSAETTPSRRNVLTMMLAWLVSFNLTWFAAAGSAEYVMDWDSGAGSSGTDTEDCYRFGDYDRLAALPADTVLAVSNLGASILRHTPHRTLAGSYHRNVEGNLATLDIFTGSTDAARKELRRLGVGLIAHCPGNAETLDLTERAPGSLIADLASDRVPAWLEVLPGTETAALRLYRVRTE